MTEEVNWKEGADHFLSVRDLVVEYTAAGEVIHAVNGVSFDLERGETLGLVGETGAGKTTIAKAILRILPDPPAKVRNGNILLNGVDLYKISEHEMRKVRGEKISMIFQDPMTALNPVMTVGDQIAEAIELHHKEFSPKEVTERACEMLEKVGIAASRYGDYPHQFSGGMKQRVVIAMSLACNPLLILADEPTTALDVTIQAQVLDMMKALREEQNTSMILITHDLGVVAETCDKVAVVYAGQIIELGSKEEIFDDPRHPYTLGLFGSLPTLTGDEKRLHPIDGMPPNPADLPEGCAFNPRCGKACDACRKKDKMPELIHIGGTHYVRCFDDGVKEKKA
ncbi:MAG: ABC transporter ATP-binding protein [Lachnospiraceae bacterium]|nr:ABC transporter ATP-binding protein [Lachnospiraceae bacterium]